MLGLQQHLSGLRSQGDREGFRRLVDAVAGDRPQDNLRFCLPELRPGDGELLLDLGDQDLLVRPCFGWPGAVLTVRTVQALELLCEIGDGLGPGIARLVVVPGVGSEGIGELLRMLPLSDLRSLRVEGNDLRARRATVRSGRDNVVHLRFEGDEDLMQTIAALRTLEDLRLADNRLTATGVAVLVTLPELRRLDLSNNPLGDAGAERLTHGLPLLRDLRVAGCGLGDVGAEVLGLSREGLERLDLRRNSISEPSRELLGRLDLGRLLI
jgi:hypothetical protein